MNKIYCYAAESTGHGVWAQAITEDGKILASHGCSNEGYIKHDLGITSNWNGNRTHYDECFGAGNWEAEFVPLKEIESHAGLQKALQIKAQS